ncbi:MAG: glycosyltransferase family 2 protein [Patescibacteria group bacterium]
MISIIIPFYNEEKNISLLHKELSTVLVSHKYEYEIIFIDDGSDDSSKVEIENILLGDKHVQLFIHRKIFGKGEALQTGLRHAKGDIIIFMDADLQDDPHDFPAFIAKMKEGYDFVNGVRVDRKDNIIIKTYSRIAKIFLNIFLRSPFTDINCGFKGFRKEVLDEVVLYGNSFRFFPLAAHYKGFKVTEIPVHNRARRFGKSKFGISKLFTGIFDTVTAHFLYRFAEKPLHFFGAWGMIFFGTGFIITFYLAIERIFFDMPLYRRPLLQLGILLIIVGIQVMMTGIIGELIVYMHKKKS